MDIAPDTNINAMLSEYPELEKFLMELHPKYRKLKNPILRRTVGRIATLKQVAMIGGFELYDLVNRLRKEVGQEALAPQGNAQENDTAHQKTERPDWIDKAPSIVLDGTQLLDQEKNPLAETKIALNTLEAGEVLLLKTDFMPAPLIDTFKEQGYKLYCEEIDKNSYKTYLTK